MKLPINVSYLLFACLLSLTATTSNWKTICIESVQRLTSKVPSAPTICRRTWQIGGATSRNSLSAVIQIQLEPSDASNYQSRSVMDN